MMLAASRGKGQVNSDSTTYNNSHVSGGNAVNITSGADTNVIGGNVKANQVTANVGGNLSVESLQDTANSQASQKTTGLSISIPIVGTGGSASLSQSKQNSNSTHVNDFVGTLFGGNTPTGGDSDTAALDAHSSYTGEITTSDKNTPQLPGVQDLLSPEKLKQLTNESWGFSTPVVVPPRTKPAHEGEAK